MLSDLVQSKKNVTLLRDFAVRSFRSDWSKKELELQNAIDIHLPECIAESLETYQDQTESGENLANVNVSIWKLLKRKVSSTLEGLLPDPQDLVQKAIQFKNESVLKAETKSDSVIPDRVFTNVHEHYIESWNTK